MNDGLESTTLESTKRRSRTSYPPNRKGPTPGRVAAKCISSPEKSPEAAKVGKQNKASALKGIPSNANIETLDVSSPVPSTLTGVQKLSAESLASPSLTGILSMTDTATSPNHTTKPTGAKKGGMQLLNEHHKLRDRPQMCSICGRVFDQATSLNRHMYSQDEMRFQCEKCDFRCHFESELLSHNIVHHKTPTHKCMVTNCGRWFKRKWELTNHIHTHEETMLKCDTCHFTTKLNKHLKEHKKPHKEDLPYECKICHKRFQYGSGRKRHTDKDHKRTVVCCCIICVHMC